MAEIQVNINSAATVKRQKDWVFNESVPKEKFSAFKCKYMISVDEAYLAKMGESGYIWM